jgi:uncharacterized membrane protein YvbJ
LEEYNVLQYESGSLAKALQHRNEIQTLTNELVNIEESSLILSTQTIKISTAVMIAIVLLLLQFWFSSYPSSPSEGPKNHIKHVTRQNTDVAVKKIVYISKTYPK